MHKPRRTEFRVGDGRQPVRAVNYAGNQVAHFDRKSNRPILPHGYVVSATYLEQAQMTRVEFTDQPPASRPLYELGQWLSRQVA
jgi:hypothetical protein